MVNKIAYWVGSIAVVAALGVVGAFFAPPDTSAILAAWVQAIGSILAILAAIWIGRESENSRRTTALKMGNLFASTLIEYMADLHQAHVRCDVEMIKGCVGQLEELQHWGRTIDIHYLSAEQARSVFDMRACVALALSRVKEFNPMWYNSKEGANFFDRLRSRVADLSRSAFAPPHWMTGPGAQ